MKNKWLIVTALVLVFSLAICALVACDDASPEPDQIISESGASVEGGSFPEGSKLAVTPISERSDQGQDVLEAIKDQEYNVFKPVYIFDISVVKDNAKVQPDGKVKVTIPVTAECASYRAVLHIKDNGTIERLSATYADGKITFETDSFSIFVLVEPVVINDHTHTFSDEWSSDKTHHWHVATCGHDDQKSDLGEHIWNDGTEIKPATEKEAGQIKYVCTVCDYEIIETTQTHTHTFSKEWSSDKTHHWHAATCAHTDLKDSYAEHRYEENSWEIKKPATETEEGVKVRVCIGCKYEDRQSIPKLEHVHTYSDAWTSDGTYHWHASTCGHADEITGKAACSGGTATCTQKAICSVCRNEYGDKLPHDFTQKVTMEPYLAVAATCQSPAKYYYSCTCGEKGTETFEDTYGRLAICSYDDAEVCTVCKTPASDWFVFAIRADGESHEVTGTQSPNGRKTEYLVVPSTYNDKPVVEIADQAFYYSTLNPKHLVLPDSIQIVGSKVLYPYIETITIGKGLQTIDDFSFGNGNGGCENLRQITVSADNPYFKVVDGVMYTKDGKTLVKYPALREGTEFTIDSNVETIWSCAFEATQNLKKVVIPDNVTTMMHHAFCNSSITSVDIGSGIETITESAFAGSKLQSVVLDGNVKTIGINAFLSCDELKTVTFGAKVATIGDYAFKYCIQLTAINIPNNVTKLGINAFEGTNNVKSIVIGSGIEEIPESAFDNSAIYKNNNPSITIGSNVKTIGAKAFSGAKIRSITIPASVTTIGNNAFENCQQLASIVIPNTVTSLDTACFKDCKLLAKVTLSNQLTEIPGSAFQNCAVLTSITIPDSVKAIGSYAFANCKKLETINFGTGLTSIGDNAFEYCEKLTSITIPNGVEELGHNLFKGCSTLKTVVLPASINKISGYTFMDCPVLESVTFDSTEPKVMYFDFSGIYTYTFDSVEKTISMLSNKELKYYNYYYLYSLATYNKEHTSSPITEETKVTKWEERATA